MKKRFVFTNKGSDEVVGISEVPKSQEEAIEFFAKIKKLSIDDFIKLYDVKEVEKK
jgi:hypothetical protein